MKSICYSLLIVISLAACGQEIDPSVLEAKQVVNAVEESPTISTVNIGGVEIANKNFNLLHYRNGDPIPLATNAEEWGEYCNSWTGCAAYVNFDSTSIYGLVYNGFVLADDRELAPEGCHVSSRSDWETISKTVAASEDTMSGLKSTKYWKTAGTNSTGFNALPTGYFVDDEWGDSGEGTEFWTNEPEPSGNDKMYYYYYMLNENNFSLWYDHNMYGYCIRIVKD